MQIHACRISLLSMLCAAVLVSACGGGDKKPVASQIAAKVNKEEISVHQVNGALARVGNLPPEQAKQVGREVLDKLIDQELLVQKALDKKLDRDAAVMQALEASRKQILAQAYMERLLASAGKSSSDEVKAYFDKHPELFSGRRVYRFQEMAIASGQDLLPALQEKMAKAKTLNDVVAWLKEKNIQIAGNISTKTAEQLPMEMLPKFSQMKDGEIAVIPGDKNILLIQLVASQPAPIDLQTATPVIERFLGNQHRTELAVKELKELRTNAKIEYVGEFAKDEATLLAEAKAATDAKAKEKADAEAKAKAEADAKAKADADADARIRAEIQARTEAQAKADAEAKANAPAKAASADASVGKEALSKGLSGLR